MKRLELTDVCVRFGGLLALSDVSFKLDPGEILGLIGPNGAGKTTIFNVITGVYQTSSGEVTFAEESILGRRPYLVLQSGIARTFQNIRLFSNMTALENVMIAQHSRSKAGVIGAVLHTPSQRREEARIKEKSMEALAFMGMETVHGTMAKNLPYGLQRRLEIARAMASAPSVILLDEPAAGLNPVETNELMDDIRRIVEKDISVLLVEHDMKLVMGVCDRIVVVDHGVKIAEGLPHAIQNDPTVIEAYLGQPAEQ